MPLTPLFPRAAPTLSGSAPSPFCIHPPIPPPPPAKPDAGPAGPAWTPPDATPAAAATAALAAAAAAAAQGFPPQPAGEVVLDMTCVLTPQEAWRLVAAGGSGAGASPLPSSPSPLDTAFAAARGDTGLVASPWAVAAREGGGGGDGGSGGGAPPTIRTRRVRYTTPLKRSWLGPPAAACDAVWACAGRGEAGWAITQTVHTPGVPFGDCFHTRVLIVAAAVGVGVGGGAAGVSATAAPTTPPPSAPLPPAGAAATTATTTTSVTAFPSSSTLAAAAAAAPASHPPAKGRPCGPARPDASPSPGKVEGKHGHRRSHAAAAAAAAPRRLTRITVSGCAVFTAPIPVPGVRALVARSTADGLRDSYALYGRLLAAAVAGKGGGGGGGGAQAAGGRQGRGQGEGRAGEAAAVPPTAGLVMVEQRARPAAGVANMPPPAAVAALAVAAVAVTAAAVVAATGDYHAHGAAGWLAAAGAAAAHAAAAVGEAVGWG